MQRCRAVLRLALLLAAPNILQPASAAPLPNAWQVTDSSSSGASGGNYSTNLPSPQQSAALTDGWRLSVNCRLVDDFNDTATMVFLYGVGTNRFSVYLDLDSTNNLTATPFNQSTVTLTTNGTGSALYHTHEIVYNPTSKQRHTCLTALNERRGQATAVA